MKNIINVNFMGTSTLNIFVNGKMYQKNFGSVESAKENFLKIQSLKKQADDDAVFAVKAIIDTRILIGRLGGMVYEPETGNIFLEGFETPMPEKLVERIELYVNEGLPIEPLIKFWKLLMANPDRRVRNDLFKFLDCYDYSITDEGYFVAYKAVAYKQENDNDLVSFVSNSYLKVKRWKKSPVNFVVTQDSDEQYHIVDLKKSEVSDEHTEIGNLNNLFKNIDNLMDEQSTVFTDIHTRKMEIRLGQPVTMERYSADGDPRRECSSGLHVGATKYVKSFGGTTAPVLTCLVNPMNVVAVPEYDNSKIRVCEYFPFALNERDEETGMFETIEQPYFEEDYVNYEKKELEAILEQMKQGEEIEKFSTANNAAYDNRDVEELKKIIEARLVSINSTEV